MSEEEVAVELTMPEGYEVPADEVIEEAEESVEVQEDTEVSESVSYVEDFDPENPTEEQELALSRGWRPEGVPGKDSRTAREFNMVQPFYDEIHRLKQNDKKKQKAIDALIQHSEQVADGAYKKALDDLKQQKIAAIEEADGEAVLAIDEKIDEIKAQQQKNIVEVEESESLDNDTVANMVQDRFNEWESQNDWYNSNDILKSAANGFITEYVQANKSEPPAQTEEEFAERLNKLYQYVDSKMKDALPKTPDKRPAAVTTGSRKPASKSTKGFGFKDLKSDADKQAARVIISTGVSEETYFKNLEKSGYFD